LSGTIQVSRYQKKHSPTHTYHGHPFWLMCAYNCERYWNSIGCCCKGLSVHYCYARENEQRKGKFSYWFCCHASVKISIAVMMPFYHAMHYSAMHGLAIACCLSVCMSLCPSVTLVDQDHIGWKSWKLIAGAISPTSSLFVAQRSSTFSQRNTEKFGGD